MSIAARAGVVAAIVLADIGVGFVVWCVVDAVRDRRRARVEQLDAEAVAVGNQGAAPPLPQRHPRPAPKPPATPAAGADDGVFTADGLTEALRRITEGGDR